MTRPWELRLGDCLAEGCGLSSLPDRAVDVVITDPPYGEHIYRNTRTNRGRPDLRTPHDVDHARELASRAIGSIDAILRPVAAELLRVARRWIVTFHDAESSGKWREALGGAYVRAGAWVKTDPIPQISADRAAQGFEAITIAHPPGRKRWNGGGRAAVWLAGRCQGPARPDHPCPKPVELMERLVRDFSDRGELILDPFAGSGTTGVAAWRLGRRFLGWERNPKYHGAADRRLAAAHEQLELPALDRVRPANDADRTDEDDETERAS